LNHRQNLSVPLMMCKLNEIINPRRALTGAHHSCALISRGLEWRILDLGLLAATRPRCASSIMFARETFFKSLAEWPNDQQVIVLENDEPL